MKIGEEAGEFSPGRPRGHPSTMEPVWSLSSKALGNTRQTAVTKEGDGPDW